MAVTTKDAAERATKDETVGGVANTQKKEEAKPKERKPKDTKVNFFFPKAKGAVFNWRNGDKSIRVKAKNGMLVLDSKNEDEAFAIKQLKADPRNRANDGRMFVEVKSGDLDTGTAASEIDKLIEMDSSAIIAMLGGEITLHRLTKGGLIAKVLGLD